MAPHSSTLAWKIPWTEEPGRLQSMGSLRVGLDWATSLSLSFTGEGNGNPLQCSSLENPRDGGAWWAAVYGVAQSRTRLKRLSSSSSISVAAIASQLDQSTFIHLSWHLCVCMQSCFSPVGLFEILKTVAGQAPLSMRFSRQEYWSGLPFPPPEHLTNRGIEPMTLMSSALPGGFFTTSPYLHLYLNMSHFTIYIGEDESLGLNPYLKELSKGFSPQNLPYLFTLEDILVEFIKLPGCRWRII